MSDDVVSAPRTARARARIEITAEIVRSARRQLDDVGPGELSLRAVARDLGMVSSALYRYFASRDELLTALLVTAYEELGEAAEAADAAVIRRDDHADRFRAVATAIRTWALTHPHDYALLYGSPVHGYVAPEETIAPASRVTTALVGILAESYGYGAEPLDGSTPVSAQARASIRGAREFVESLAHGEVDDRATVAGVMAWATIFGTLSFELWGHFVNAVDDGDAYYAQMIEQLVTALGLT